VRAENHYLDCETIAVAMAQSLGFHRRVRKSQAAQPSADRPPEMPAIHPPGPAPKVQRQPGPPRRGNWSTKW